VRLFIAALALTAAAAHAQPQHAQANGHGTKRTGSPVASPNRLTSAQLASNSRPPWLAPSDRGTDPLVLVDARGRIVGRSHAGFFNAPLVTTRLQGMSVVIDGLTVNAKCDAVSCRFSPGLDWYGSGTGMLVYPSTDCSGPPELSFPQNVAGFDAIAMAVNDTDGTYLYLARNTPRETWVRSYRNRAENVCQAESPGYPETTLPVEAVYPTSLFGTPPMRWR